ncbi:hypothetical protein [Variovorax sp. GT1P44]|uniref:hypothetical protein n=1 Tax=Variovorax sp. GT1P44 TaxID=3443742 RepID=UPI003F474247
MSTDWKRPVLPVTRPNRNFGGVYRSAEGEQAGETFGGVPMQTTSDAVIAAVQLGYKVADAQLSRGRRLASHLGGAASRAGVKSAAQPVDATERLMKRAMLLMIEWFEGAAGDPQSALRRVMRAEYDALGSAFGLTRKGAGKSAHRDGASPDKEKERTQDAPPSSAAPTSAYASRTSQAQVQAMQVRHGEKSVRRFVRVLDVEWISVHDAARTDLLFHHGSALDAEPLEASLVREKDATVLVVTTTAKNPPGVWSAAVCAADGTQVGFIEIRL